VLSGDGWNLADVPPATVASEDCDFNENVLELDATAQQVEFRNEIANVHTVALGMGCGAGVAVVASPTTAISLRVVTSRFQGNRATGAF
jgi:hypothetical protein